MVDDRGNGTPLKGTFLVWSWMGLLAAYVYTAVSYGSLTLSVGIAMKLPPSMGGGPSGYSLFRQTSVLAIIVPIVILALACFVFLRYSVATYRMAVLESHREGDGEELLLLFRSSLVWLIVVWIVALALKALPIVLNQPFGR